MQLKWTDSFTNLVASMLWQHSPMLCVCIGRGMVAELCAPLGMVPVPASTPPKAAVQRVIPWTLGHSFINKLTPPVCITKTLIYSYTHHPLPWGWLPFVFVPKPCKSLPTPLLLRRPPYQDREHCLSGRAAPLVFTSPIKEILPKWVKTCFSNSP